MNDVEHLLITVAKSILWVVEQMLKRKGGK